MPSRPLSAAPSDEYVSLLDLIVVAAESWRPLLLLPLATAAIAFGLASIQPREYRSAMSLAATPEAVREQLTDGGMGQIATTTGLAAIRLDSDLTIQPISQSNFNLGTMLTAQFNDAAMTTRVLGLVAERMALALEGGETDLPLSRLDADLAEVERSIAFYNDAVADLTKQFAADKQSNTMLERVSTANILTQAIEMLRQLNATREGLMQARSGLNSQLVISAPTAPRPADSFSPFLTAVLAALSAGLLVLIWIFIREGLRRSSTLPGGADKLARIGRAFSFSRTKT